MFWLMESLTASPDTVGLQGFTPQRFVSTYFISTCNALTQVVESGVSFLNVMANGGSGDVDLYVRKDEYPTQVHEKSASFNNINMKEEELRCKERTPR